MGILISRLVNAQEIPTIVDRMHERFSLLMHSVSLKMSKRPLVCLVNVLISF